MIHDSEVKERQTPVISGEISPLREVDGWGADPRNLIQRESRRVGIFWGAVPGWGGHLLLVRHDNHQDLTIYRASELQRDLDLVWAVLASRTRRDEEAPSDPRPLSAAELL